MSICLENDVRLVEKDESMARSGGMYVKHVDCGRLTRETEQGET